MSPFYRAAAELHETLAEQNIPTDGIVIELPPRAWVALVYHHDHSLSIFSHTPGKPDEPLVRYGNIVFRQAK